MEKEQLQILKLALSYLKKYDLSKALLQDILSSLLARKDNELLINLHINSNGTTPAKFCPSTKSIDISLNKMILWATRNSDDLIEKFQLKDNDDHLTYYLYLYLITHEIAHSYQYLYGKKIIPAPNDVLASAYENLMDVLNPPKYILPHPIKQTRRNLSLILYKIRQNNYLLERNANIESTRLISTLAKEENNEELFNLFSNMQMLFLKLGYTKSNVGSIEETFKALLMYDKFQKFNMENSLSDEDKIYYGFRVNEDVRQRLLHK